ncbi:MAG: ParB/RepB/Spo0J family partition protein [Oscillospiraceae bacterium]|nr:ParB/RepB/Spo0J family partition protein [Oscillospiraceae bacterium]
MNGLFKQKEKIAGQVIMADVGMVIPNKSQPRKEFNDDALRSLSQSIKENGILQPIIVRRRGAIYEIISGERRFRAAKLAGMTEVPCIIKNVGEEESAVLALIENIQRKDLSYFEEAIAIEKLLNVYGLTQEQAAVRLGKAQSTIANKIRLLRFTEGERRLLLTGGLSERQARALIRIDDDLSRSRAIETVVSKRLSIEQTEELVNLILSETPQKRRRKSAKVICSVPARLYLNSLNALIKRIRDDKVPCELSESKSENFYEYTLRFPINI